MTAKEALESLKFEVYEEGHCSYIEEEIGVAIAALEKQIPKKPTKDRMGRIQCVNGHNLPAQRYCPMCGQLIDWSDWE